MEDRENQEKRNTERIINEAKYRIGLKRKLRQFGIPSLIIRNSSTKDLEVLCNLSSVLL